MCSCSNSKSNKVSDGGDGDGHPGMLHGLAQPLHHALALVLLGQGVPTLDDDEHVVDADTEHQEGDDGVGGGVPEADGRANAVAVEERTRVKKIIRS